MLDSYRFPNLHFHGGPIDRAAGPSSLGARRLRRAELLRRDGFYLLRHGGFPFYACPYTGLRPYGLGRDCDRPFGLPPYWVGGPSPMGRPWASSAASLASARARAAVARARAWARAARATSIDWARTAAAAMRASARAWAATRAARRARSRS